MKIFISWSGSRSKLAAVALREWLPLVLYYAQPWMSERDVAAGERWAVEIGKELEGTQFGLIVLTGDNLSAPWILFEAGALSKAFTASAVCPLLVDVDFKDVTGPLSQFQAKKAERESLLELLQAINAKATQPVDPNRLIELFDALWPRIEARLRALPVARAADAKPRSQGQILEELVVSVRRMEARLEMVGARSAPAEKPSVEVWIDGSFPALDKAESISFVPGRDVIDDIATFAHLQLEQFEKEWFLREKKSGRLLSREDGRRIAVRARRIPQQIILADAEGERRRLTGG